MKILLDKVAFYKGDGVPPLLESPLRGLRDGEGGVRKSRCRSVLRIILNGQVIFSHPIERLLQYRETALQGSPKVSGSFTIKPSIEWNGKLWISISSA